MIVQQSAKIHSLIRYVGWPLLSLLIWDVAVTVGYYFVHDDGLDLPSLPVTLFGSALVLFLGLRNNAAYARWWEARTLWGAVVNASRSFSREALFLIRDQPQTAVLRETLVQRQVAFAHALRLHLLRLDNQETLMRLLPQEAESLRRYSNVPNALLSRNAADLRRAVQEGWLDAYERVRIEATLVDLSNAQGGLERIKNTPLPKQYGQYPKFFVSAFCVLLPVGLVDSLWVYTPLASTIVGFLLLTIEKMGKDLQDPFSNEIHDVPMASICSTIQIDLMESIGAPAPRPAQSVGGVLW